MNRYVHKSAQLVLIKSTYQSTTNIIESLHSVQILTLNKINQKNEGKKSTFKKRVYGTITNIIATAIINGTVNSTT